MRISSRDRYRILAPRYRLPVYVHILGRIKIDKPYILLFFKSSVSGFRKLKVKIDGRSDIQAISLNGELDPG
jgi:hypothetical protein